MAGSGQYPELGTGPFPQALVPFEYFSGPFWTGLANARVVGSVHVDFMPAGAAMPVPSTPGPGWRFELLLGTLAALLFAAAVLAPHLHLNLRWHQSVQAPHSKSL